jgi:predicted dehydrogenase
MLPNSGAEVRAASFALCFPAGAWKAQTNFLDNQSLGGGPFHDVLSHQVDLLCWLLGEPEAVRAWHTDSERGRVVAELRFSTCTARCEAGHGAYVEHLELELGNRVVVEATGSAVRTVGRRFRRWRRRRAQLVDRFALLESRVRGRANESLLSFERQLRDFERSTRGDSSTGATAEDGLRAIEIVDACRLSAAGGGGWRAPIPRFEPVA